MSNPTDADPTTTMTMIKAVLSKYGITDASSLFSVDERFLLSCERSEIGDAGDDADRAPPDRAQEDDDDDVSNPSEPPKPQPTSSLYDFPSNAFTNAVSRDAVGCSPSTIHTKNHIEQDTPEAAAALEAQVRRDLISFHVTPMPILKELDRDLAMQRRALDEYATYRKRCEDGTLYPQQQVGGNSADGSRLLIL